MRSASARLVVVPLLALLAACGGGQAPAPPPEKGGTGAAGISAALTPGAEAAPAAPFAIDVSPALAEKWIGEHPDTVLLDVRTPAEFADGHLQGGLLLDFDSPDFADKLTSLDKTKTYLVYCRSGRRSGKTRDMMREAGFQRIVHLDGGIQAWQSAGKTVAR